MKYPWLSAILNFFFMGPGYIYNGKKVLLGILLTITAVGLTYLENFHTFSDGTNLQAHDPTAYAVLFACVFTANTGLAIDGYREAKEVNADKENGE